MTSVKSQRLFGTDGIRGKAYEYPLDLQTVEIIGYSLTDNLARILGEAPKLIIGRDTRESGEAIQLALTRGARAGGAFVESAGVITTPGIAFLTKRVPFDAGVVISASHNPFFDNGIKVFSPTGKKLADEMERRIEEDVADVEYSSAARRLFKSVDPPGREADAHVYAEGYLRFLAVEVARDLRLDGLRLAVDCANGAASTFAPELFLQLGAMVEVISAAPDGRNINENCGALHINSLRSLVQAGGFDLGIAFDGDADRALFVDSNGKLIDGDYTLLILAEALRGQGRLTSDLVVSTVMSNLGLELALQARGIVLVRAQVGDRFVLEEMLKRKACLGGEQSGHIIIKDVSLAGDGIITAIELMRAIRDKGRSLADLASAMKTYPQVLINVKVKSKPPLESVPELKAAMTRLENEMRGRGRLLVRYSGTENLLRVMIEGEKQQIIDTQAHQLAGVIQRVLG
jgi:phosphoglucosamine mutase